MHTPEIYVLDALEQVLSWDLPDDEIAEAANQQARLMAGLPADAESPDAYPCH